MNEVTYTVRQRLYKGGRLTWTVVGQFRERDDRSCRVEGLRRFLRDRGVNYDGSTRCRWLYSAAR